MESIRMIPSWNRQVSHASAIHCGAWNCNFVAVECNRTDMANLLRVEIDNWADGRFHSRDWTRSGLPMIEDGEVYWSGFWFEFRKDADKFASAHRDLGAIGSWEVGFDEEMAERNKKRNTLTPG